MSDTAKIVEPDTLKLDAAWRIPDREAGATIHPLHVVPGSGRPEPPDGDALRALVAEIVREELRSDLGRRMTGSIRRLVREELARIFARLGGR